MFADVSMIDRRAQEEYFLLARSDDPGDISLRDALAPFGLKLEPQKAMLEYILVDHAVKPSAN
jgi:uncharacterized protein (TIGR03435 family)